MRELYRSMRLDAGLPMVGDSARKLGVREPEDVRADAHGNIFPGAGMSVAPDDPWQLPIHRRPSEFGGTGADPVWMIRDDGLAAGLDYVQDSPRHGIVGPAAPVSLVAFRGALADTRHDWDLV